ncbi:hypothetical protein [Rhodococcus sp. IEGM 1408]|uniref:hypothetical protein n=1 Tax=Rhodococcus sp. IEGM 1408 TaxID=3082220 RepID=UPI0029552A3C|nr:hypothetical protein [Rhodococcus sp. IEGM 1408]MDV8001409.1 hypothetical protein [Rhodococcus sp. IEGM 1408]
MDLDLGEGTASGGAFGLDDLLSVQLRATPVVPGQDVFIGIAEASDVEATSATSRTRCSTTTRGTTA